MTAQSSEDETNVSSSGTIGRGLNTDWRSTSSAKMAKHVREFLPGQRAQSDFTAVTVGELQHIQFQRWAETMSMGRFEEGWQINDRLGCHWPSAHRLWDGQGINDLNITACLRHGLGDAVQMLRYAPLISRLGGSVRYEVPEPLKPLLAYFDGVLDCSNSQISPGTAIEMLELPYLFRTQLTDLPLLTRYLVLPDTLINHCRNLMGPTRRRRIGLVWAGGEWDRERWVQFAMLDPLIRDKRFEWWNLQGGSALSEGLGSPLRTTSGMLGGGLIELAATMANLDLVITIDTLAAHMAGAIGIPTWLMLKCEGDWRWMKGRSDSPWYPSLRIFRQLTSGNWKSVIEQIHQALNGL